MEMGKVERIYAACVISRTKWSTKEMENDVCTLVENGRKKETRKKQREIRKEREKKNREREKERGKKRERER
jgi:hypothetical protein